ncbi:MAG: heme-binding protein [Proteobacteria bacterium]|nr:heme-binding protein [Pseudomonadota bacterium]
MGKNLVSFFLLLVGLPMSVIAIEKPPYELVDQFEAVEVRAYPDLVVARTWVDAPFDAAGSTAFRRLGGYIFGDNQAQQKIAMTSPVSQSPAEGGGYWVTFFMPSAYDLNSLPQPEDEKVELTRMPATTFAVLRYKGGWSEKKYRDHEARLLEELRQQENWQPLGEAVWARYNPPFMPAFLRTNEVMIPVVRVSETF